MFIYLNTCTCILNVVFIYQVIDAFKSDVASSTTALQQALVGKRPKRNLSQALRDRHDQLKTLCSDLRDGRKDMVRFLVGIAAILRPTKIIE